MRRLSLVLSVLAVIGFAFTYSLVVPAPEAGASPAMQNRPVNMTVSCDGGDVGEVRIVPFTLRLRKSQNERATWRLQQASDVDSVTVRVKEGSSWPFTTTDPSPNPPLTVPRGGGNAVTSGTIDPSAEGTYLYDILVDCGSGETVIDPRMDIDP